MSDNRISPRAPASRTDAATSAQPSSTSLGAADVQSSSTIRSPGVPEVEIVRSDGRSTGVQTNQGRSSENVRSPVSPINTSSASAITPSSATRPPPHSILHNSSSSSNKTPQTPAADNSLPDDRHSNASSRKTRSVSFKDGIGGGRQRDNDSNAAGNVEEFVSSRLKKSNSPFVPTWIASQNQNAVASSSRPPVRLDPAQDFFNPANAPFEDEEFEAFRPRTPELLFEPSLPGAVPPALSNSAPAVAAASASRADTRNSNPQGAQPAIPSAGFQMETVSPAPNDPLGRPATPAGVSSPPGKFLTADAHITSGNQERRADHRGERGRGRGRSSLPDEPRRPTREEEIKPLKNPNVARHHYPPNRHGSPSRGQRRRVPRRSPDRPFKVYDPYVFPKDQKKSPIPPLLGAVRWAITAAEEWLGGDTSGSGEGGSDANTGSTSSTLNGKGKEPRHPKGDLEHGQGEPLIDETGAHPGIKSTRTTRIVQSTRAARGTVRTSDAVAVGTMEPNKQLDSIHNLELVQKIHQARTLELDLETQRVQITRERARLEEERAKFLKEKAEFERSRPVPTPIQPEPLPEIQPRETLQGISKTFPGEYPPSIAGSAPAGHVPSRPGEVRGALSPPKASPDHRPASDPVSPTQRQSPFDFNAIKEQFANVRDVEVVVENTLRKYLRDVVIQVYRHFLLRMPSMYSHRVERVIEQAHLSEAEVHILIKIDKENGRNSAAGRILDTPARYALEDLEETRPLIGPGNSPSNSPYQPSIFKSLVDNPQDLESGAVPIDPNILGDRDVRDIARKVKYFQTEWETFVDSLVREWKTLNVVNALLIGALLTVFQIEEAQYVPSTRTCALISLSTALLSLLFGGIYIIRFGTMRPLRKAIIWVDESQKQTQTALWNIWVMLALPGIWLGYSIMSFIATILSFVWTSGNGKHVNPPDASDTSGVILAPRIIISIIFVIGAIYFIAALRVFAKWKGVSMRTVDRRQTSSTHGSVDNTPGTQPGDLPPEIRPLDTSVLGVPRAASGTPSALRLELTPGGVGKPSNQLIPTLTTTPPMMSSVELAGVGQQQGPVTTIVTQPTPLTAVDPLAPWGSLAAPIAPSPAFQLREQTHELDQPLPVPLRQASAPTTSAEFGTPRSTPRALPPVREESAGF